MINFKPAIRLHQMNSQKKVNVKIRISFQRKTRYLSTQIFIDPKEFDAKAGKIKKINLNANYLNLELSRIVLALEHQVINFNQNGTMKSLLLAIKNINPDTDIFDMLKSKIDKLKSLDKVKTYETYEYTLNVLKKFTGLERLDFKNIDSKFLSDFETWLKIPIEDKKKLSINSVSIHMRNIRAIFNQAIDDKLISQEYYPFRRFKIKSEKTAKRNIPVEQIRAIIKDKLTGKEAYMRDLFILSFYLIGINLKDLYYLDKVSNGRLNYRRFKTGRLYDIKILLAASEIIERYKGEERLLNCSELYCNSNNFMKAFNKFLKRIAIKLGIKENLTSYYARHSWATIASKIGISKDVISHALGHGNNTVTDVYIDFDLESVDFANESVVNYLQLNL